MTGYFVISEPFTMGTILVMTLALFIFYDPWDRGIVVS